MPFSHLQTYQDELIVIELVNKVEFCFAKRIPVYRMLPDNSDRYAIYTPIPEYILKLPNELLPQSF